MKSIIIHGHFYQPPRENPWTGIIEDQPSASPFSNWNQKIDQECYSSNIYSPSLNGEGEIENFTNNYESLSFNFGPTLLDWLRQESNQTYKNIIEADKISCKRFNGHGNALAQVYNHSILPLATIHDKRTQILWGIEDFKANFKRDPEGMWLAETAIDLETASLLVESGIKFTILSPQQANHNHKHPDRLWQKPWKIKTKQGDLGVFFYNPELSTEVSFSHLLQNADHFYQRIQETYTYSNSSLISIASDGEIYGHHEKLGNLGLSALINKIKKNPNLKFTNFGEAYSLAKDIEYIDLFPGKDHKGSSWSCYHGVSRWYEDCGCQTGGEKGWNQKWRGPLRGAIEKVASLVDSIFEREMKLISPKDPFLILNDYIKIKQASKTYINQLRQGLNIKQDKELEKVLLLLEGEKFKHFAFTSCGWFFADIEGLEPRQNLQYLGRMIDIYQNFTDINLTKVALSQLKIAKSNLKPYKNGAEIFLRERLAGEKQFYSELAETLALGYFINKNQFSKGKISIKIEPKEIEVKQLYTLKKEQIPYKITKNNNGFLNITLFPKGKIFEFDYLDFSFKTKKILYFIKNSPPSYPNIFPLNQLREDPSFYKYLSLNLKNSLWIINQKYILTNHFDKEEIKQILRHLEILQSPFTEDEISQLTPLFISEKQTLFYLIPLLLDRSKNNISFTDKGRLLEAIFHLSQNQENQFLIKEILSYFNFSQPFLQRLLKKINHNITNP